MKQSPKVHRTSVANLMKQHANSNEIPNSNTESEKSSSTLRSKVAQGQSIQQVLSGTRKFIDLTDPQLNQNQVKTMAQHPALFPKRASPKLQKQSKPKEPMLKQSQNKKQPTMNRCNSATLRDELMNKLPKPMSPRLTTALKANVGK